jgi:hypothetical protein
MKNIFIACVHGVQNITAENITTERGGSAYISCHWIEFGIGHGKRLSQTQQGSKSIS